MSSSAFESCAYSTEEFLSAQSIAFADEAVRSVFSMMLGLTSQPVPPSGEPIAEPNGRTGIVGISGTMRGSCELKLSSAAACAIASAMLGGAAVEESDESIDDAVGELCNMIAGGWKNRSHCLASTCTLSPPTVISGGDYKVHMSSGSAKLKRTHAFEGHVLQLTLYCLEPTSPLFG